MTVPTIPNAILLFLLGGVFIHFLQAGARTLYFTAGESSPGAAIAQGTFLFGGTIPIWFLGLHRPIQFANGLVAALVLLLSVALYEWTRHTIWGRRFGLGWGEHVPEALCSEGPYRLVRHPLYLSYLLAYVAALIALPNWITVLMLAVNLGLFVHAARHDERVLAGSALAADYAVYRQRTGMFLPRFSRAAPGR